MNKRSSQKKLNGEILLMQTELMSKLAGINEQKKATDELGFPLTPSPNQSDALLDLISKSKNIVRKTRFLDSKTCKGNRSSPKISIEEKYSGSERRRGNFSDWNRSFFRVKPWETLFLDVVWRH